jgi:hypothetical protein
VNATLGFGSPFETRVSFRELGRIDKMETLDNIAFVTYGLFRQIVAHLEA